MLGTEVEELLLKNNLPYIASDKEVDIADRTQLKKFASDKSLSWIINCAAYTAVDQAEDEPYIAFRINAEGPLNIAEIARSKGAKLIHISTDYVFDGTKEGAYAETDPANPIGVYGRSKYQGELNIQEKMQEFFILRTAWLYGKNGKNFVHTMLRLFAERNEVRVVGDQYGSPTYAPDLAEALLKIIGLNSETYGIYHFANEGKISWHDFAYEIYRTAKEKGKVTRDVLIREIATEEYPTKAQRPRNSYLSKEKIKRTFNVAIRPWQDGLRDFFIIVNASFIVSDKI